MYLDRMYLAIFGVLVKQIVIFNIGFEFCVLTSIWEQRLKIFVDPQNRKNPTPNKSKNMEPQNLKDINIYIHINITKYIQKLDPILLLASRGVSGSRN